MGRIPLPLRKTKADALRRRARQAPYGKGTETLVDLDVRRVWEVDADLVSLSGEGWDEAMAEVVAEVAEGLGLGDSEIHAHLYKLLLYEPGGFFLPHRDGEKLDGMVATLVVNLPSEHEGGELIVRHDGRRKMVRFGGPKSLDLRYAAFYADCEHEVKPVTSGRRLVLTYNLTVAKAAREADDGPAAAVAEVLGPWAREEGPDGLPPRLAVLLDHGYTQAGLSLDALKGADRARAGLLFEAARRSGCDAFLALVTLHETGMGEDDSGGGYRGRYESWDDDEDSDEDEDEGGPYTMVEVYEEELTAGHFRDAEGRAWEIGAVPLLKREVVSDEEMGDDEPDREEFEGYTGNAGMTLERWYHRAAVVLWPSASRFGVLLGYGVEAAVGGLAAMVDGRSAAKARSKEKAALGEACRDFARRLIDAWPSRRRGDVRHAWQRTDPAPSDASPLDLLETIGDVGLIAAWIRGPFARDATIDPGPALGELCDRLGWPTFADALGDAFAQTSRETVERNARLLGEWAAREKEKPGRRALCGSLAGALLKSLESGGDPDAAHDWEVRVVDRVDVLTQLVRILVGLDDASELDRLATLVLDPASGWDVVKVQVPALRALAPWLKDEARRPIPALRRWLTAVRDDLRRRTAEAPVEPVDLRRDDAIGCRCADCADVASFLRDPATATFRLRAAQDRRGHVEQQVRHRPIDLACLTERKGSPHTLVLTKTKATYERALAEHRADLKRLEEVGAMLAWCEGLG